MFKALFHMICIAGFACAYTTVSASQTSANTEHFRLYDRGWSPIAQQYMYEITRQVLEASVDQYGPYSLKLLNSKDINIKRALRNSLKGDFALLEITSTPINNEETLWRMKQISYPLYKGLLGLRKLIVRKEDASKLSQINSAETFLNYRPGLVHFWPDGEIFQHANIQIVKSHEYATLFPMLKSKRFDYLSLSLVEIEDSLDKEKAFHNSLSIHNDLYIFYPIPCYFNVLDNKQERIEYGMKKALDDGLIDKVFHQHFAKYTNSIQRENAKVFVMENPNLSGKDNKQMIDRALARYFDKKSNIYYLQKRYTE